MTRTMSSMPGRTSSVSSPRRSLPAESMPDRDLSGLNSERGTIKAVPAAGVEVRYVDRYIYVDGSMTTATVFEMHFAYGDATPQPIFSLLSGAVIAEVNVWMLEIFDGVNPAITIGKTGTPDDLMKTSEVDPAFLSSYETRPGKEYNPGETVNLYITPGAGAAHGRGVISVYII